MRKVVRGALVWIAIGAAAAPALAQSPDRALITVSGQAQIMVVPDEVVVRLGVQTIDKVLSVAKAQNDDAVRKALTAARALKIAEEDLQTSSLDIGKQYSDPDDDARPRRPREFLGYSMSKDIVIIVRDVSIVEQLVTSLLNAGVDKIDGLEYRSSKLRTYADQARAMAMQAAQQKAIALAGQIGQTVGAAYSIAEDNADDRRAFQNNVGLSSTGDYTPDESTVALGRIPVTARVVVSFRLN